MNSLDLGTFFYNARRFWWVLALSLLIGASLGYLQYDLTPTEFTSEAKMVLSGKINMQAGTSYSDETQDFMGTQATILQGQEVRSRAEKSLLTAGQKPSGPVNISVTYIPRTTIFLLRAAGPEPVYTQQLLEAVMREFINLRKEFRSQRADDATSELTKEVARVQKEAESAAQAVTEFQRKFNVVSLEDESHAEANYLDTLRKRVADLRIQRSVVATGGPAEADPSPAAAATSTKTSNKSGRDGDATPRGAAEQKLLVAKQDLAMLQTQRERLLAYLRPEHPKIKRINIRIEETQKLVTSLSSQVLADNKSRLAAIDREMDALNQEIVQRHGRLLELNKNLAEYQNLKTRLDTSRTTFDKLTASLQNVDVGKQLDQEVISILQHAISAYAGRKNLAATVAQTSILSLFLGTGIAFLLSRWTPRFQTVEAVADGLEIPVVGKILRDGWATKNRTVLDCTRGHLGFAESFRNLRSAFLNLPPDFAMGRCITVASAVPNEGKSTIAVNLAIALAATGARILLVDADLRRGKLQQLLKAAPGPGLSDLITNRYPLIQVLRATLMPNLMLLPSGPRIPNIGEQMYRYGIERLLRVLSQHFDYVIVDTPPVLAVDDAATIAVKTDGVLFVVRLGSSRPDDTHRAVGELRARQANVAAVVVNSVPRRFTGHSYYQYYSHLLENRPFLQLPAGSDDFAVNDPDSLPSRVA
jgi:succinoglycan biosynthesis transport protein ExoP